MSSMNVDTEKNIEIIRNDRELVWTGSLYISIKTFRLLTRLIQPFVYLSNYYLCKTTTR